MEMNRSIIHTVDERLVGVLLRSVLGSRRRVHWKAQLVGKRPCLAEGCSKVGHVIDSFLRVVCAFLIRTEHYVIVVLEIPVVQQGHKHLEPVQLASTIKWIVLPRPIPDVLVSVVPTLDPDIHRIIAPAVNMHALDEVVVVGVIAHRPDYAAGDRFGSCLPAELHLPFPIFAVLDVDLQRTASPVAFYKSEFVRKVWSASPAALPVE